MTDAIDLMSKEADELVGKIKPLLAGSLPPAQGAALAELLATWVVGHSPALRSEVLVSHVNCVWSLVPAIERELFGEAGHPDRVGRH